MNELFGATADDGVEPEAQDLSTIVIQLLTSTGDVKLPSLTREELCALDDTPALVHAEDHRWWSGLDDAGRALVTDTALRGLVARNLIVATGADLRLDQLVRVVLQARRDPSWLVVLREPETTEIRVVASGIDLTQDHTDAVLISARIEGIYANRLTTVHTAMASIAAWLTRPSTDTGQTPVGRTVETLVPRDPAASTELTDTRAIVLGAHGHWRMSIIGSDGEPGPAETVDPAGLQAWIAARVLPVRPVAPPA